MNAVLKAERVVKTFGSTRAVDDLDLEITEGTTCGFIGPSGAGKTTTIRLIMSILFPDSGSLSVLGQASALQAKDRIGYLPEERGVYRKMSVDAFLMYLAGLKGVAADVANDARQAAAVADWAWKTSARRNARICPRACCNGCSSSARSSTSRSC